MTRRARPGHRYRPSLALAGGLVALALTSLTEPALAQPDGERPVGAVRVSITDVGPPLTRDAASVLRLKATIVNNSPSSALRVRWRLRIAAPVHTREGLTTDFDDRGSSSVLWHDDKQVIDALPSGDRHDVQLYLPMDLLENFTAPSGPAVFPLRIEVTHRIETVIATADTFLIWYPDQQPKLRLGWLVPITDPPARDATLAVRGDDLATSVSPGGRLDGVLRALERAEELADIPLPFTLGIDAQLVESVRVLAEGSAQVAADGSGPRTQRIGSPLAAAWLSRLKAQAGRHRVIALPYADADVVAMVRANVSAALTLSARRGKEALDAELRISSIADIAWPVGEVLDASSAERLSDNGYRTIILDRLSLRRTAPRSYTTTAASPLDASARQLTAIVPDAPVTSLATDMATGGARFPLARQRLLAETAVIQQERPLEPRDLFVRFPRDWQPADLESTAALLALPATTPWLGGTTVPEAVTRPARADDRVTIPRYPQAARQVELAAAALQASDVLRTELRSFRTILADGGAPAGIGTTADDRKKAADAAAGIKAELDHAHNLLAWSESAHWRGRPGPAAELRAAAGRTLESRRGQVTVGANKVRLTSTSGSVPITVINRLPAPVRVRVDLRSERLGLTFGAVPELTVPAARGPDQPGTTSVEVPAESQTVGRFPVNVQLLTTENVNLGPPARLIVSTTAYGQLALYVTGGAFVLMVIALLIRFVVRRRRGRGGHIGPDSPEEPPAPDAALVDPPVDSELSSAAGP